MSGTFLHGKCFLKSWNSEWVHMTVWALTDIHTVHLTCSVWTLVLYGDLRDPSCRVLACVFFTRTHSSPLQYCSHALVASSNLAEVQRGPHVNTTAVRPYLHLWTSSALCSVEQREEQSEIMREARASNSLKLMITRRANDIDLRNLQSDCQLKKLRHYVFVQYTILYYSTLDIHVLTFHLFHTTYVF